MKKGLRFIMGLFLVLSLLVSLGCRKKGGLVGREEGKLTLTMIFMLDLSDSVTTANWQELLDVFGAAHPNIEFEIEYLASEAYHNKLQTRLATGQLPDLMYLWPGKRTGNITGSGQVKDLRPWLKGHEDEFVDIALQPQGSGGEVYELPEQITATHVLYTNDRLLAELGLEFPQSLAALIAQGEKIRASGLIPIAMSNGDGWQMQSCLLSALVERAGGLDWYDKAIRGQGASFVDPEFVQALGVIDTLSKEEMFSPGINQAAYGSGLNDFVNERAVYYIDGGWRINNLVGELTEEQKQHISLRTLPAIPNRKGQSGSTAAVAGTGFGMNAKLKGREAEAAWSWIWFYSGPEGAKIRQKHGAVPAYKLPPREDLDPLVGKLARFVNDTPSGYVLDAKMDAQGMGVLQPGVQEMMLGNKTPEQVAREYEAWVTANDANRK